MISTRDLVLAFFFAKLCGIVAALLILGPDTDNEQLFLIAYPGSFLALITLVSVTTKRSPLDVLREQPYRGVWRGRWWLWALAAIPIGIFLKLGTEGVVIFLMNIIDPDLFYKEFSDHQVAQKRDLSSLSSWAMLLAPLSVAAIEEEFAYRKILMTGISRSIGLPLSLFVVSLLFGLMHFNPVAFIGGASLALLYIFTGRLMVPIITHISANIAHPALDSLDLSFDYSHHLSLSYIFAIILVAALIFSIAEIRRKWLRDGVV